MASFSLEPVISKAMGDVVAGDPSARARDRILLGQVAEAGPRRKLWLDISGEQVVAVLGKRGTGKSYTLGVIAEGLAAGPGETPIAVHQTKRSGLVLDILDIFWTSQIPLSADGPPEIRKQYSLLSKSGLGPQKLNIDVWIPAGFERLEVDPRHAKSLHIGASDLELDDWGALFDVNMLVEPRGMLIIDLVSRVSRDGYIGQSGAAVPADPVFSFVELLSCINNDQTLAANYNENTIRAVRQRLETFGALQLFQGEATSLAEILRNGYVSVLMLGRAPDELKTVVVSVLLRRILRQRRDASFAQKRLDLQADLDAGDKAALRNVIDQNIPRTWVLLDEAHVLAGTDQGSVARDALIKYAKEGRNYGLSLALATQQPSAVDARLMSQVETMIIHQLTSPKDAQVALDNMRSPLPTAIRVDGTASSLEAVLRQLTPGVVTFSCGNAPLLPRVCISTIRPRVSAHGGYEA